MKILTDPDEYLKTKAWAEKTVDELGVNAARNLLEAIDARTKDCRSRNRQAALVDKLEGRSACLTLAISDRKLKDFMAPGIEAVKRVKKYSQVQSSNRQKRQTWKGLSRDQRAARDREIIAHYKKTKLTRSSFAQKYAASYGLSWRQAMNIIPA